MNVGRVRSMLVLCACVIVGCTSSAPEAPPPSALETAVLSASFVDAWQAVRQALTEQEYTIETRDRRGLFVAYEDTGRRFLIPHRTKYTIALESVSGTSTQVTVEAKDQHYRVTLLTYPAWQDTPKQMDGEGAEILRVIQSVLSEGEGS